MNPPLSHRDFDDGEARSVCAPSVPGFVCGAVPSPGRVRRRSWRVCRAGQSGLTLCERYFRQKSGSMDLWREEAFLAEAVRQFRDGI